MNKILIVNTGSDSHKYALYGEGIQVARFHFEREDAGFVVRVKSVNKDEKLVISAEDYQSPVVLVFKILIDKKIILDSSEISLIGIRIVAPGEYFLTHNIIDDQYLLKLKEAKQSAPLHIESIIREIEQLSKILPGVKIGGVSDSTFHQGLPEVARRYAIPEKDCVDFSIYRYGYHGISIASIVRKIELLYGSVPENTIVCHLGSGSSITALKNGKSVDTSMGFTPLEGLPMGSRVGNIDPGAVIALGQKKELNFVELEKYFNNECGLLALSGSTKDIRELIALENKGDKRAKLALDSFAYNIKKYIGSYIAVLGGLNLLVFTATIGERSSIMRERICSGLGGLGLVLDRNKNDLMIDTDGEISDDYTQIKIAVISTDEMGEIKEALLGQQLF